MQVLLLLLLLLSSAVIRQRCLAAASSVNVSTSRQLLQALQSSSADTIVLQNDTALGAEFDQFDRQPLLIQRNITLTGPAGSNSSIDAAPKIDLQNRVGILELCSSCLFRILGVSLANDNRAGAQGGTSAFRGQPGSRIEWVTGVGLRLACPPTAEQLPLVKATARSPLFPSPAGGQQLAITNFTYRGQHYQDMLRMDDLSLDVVPLQLTKTAFTGGYASRRMNVTRLCQYIIPAACLSSKLPEECVAELLAGNISSAVNSSSTVTPPGEMERRRAVAIAVPVVAGGVLLLLLLLSAALWLRTGRCRRWRRRWALDEPKTGDMFSHHTAPDAAAAAAAAAAPDAAAAAADGLFHGPPDLGVAGTTNRSAPVRQTSSSSFVQQSQASLGADGWKVLWSSSATYGGPGSGNIDLGVMLGAGSFARVYKGRWSGLDVAVKVIHHDRDSVNTVATEVQLMLSLNHPNIVRAYHCVTKQLMPAQQHRPAASPPRLRFPISEGNSAAAGQHLPLTPYSSAAMAATGAGTPQQQPHWFSSLYKQQQREPSTDLSADVVPLSDRGFAVSLADSMQPQQPQQRQHAQAMASGEIELLRLRGSSSLATTGSLVQAGAAVTAAAVQSQTAPPSMAPKAAASTYAGASTGIQSLVRAGTTSSSSQQLQQQQQPADSGSFVGEIGPGFAVMTLPQAGSISPGTAAIVASAMAILSCSTASGTSTDSLMVPRSMSTLQGSAGPTSLLGSSLIGSMGSGIMSTRGSAGTLPTLGVAGTAAAVWQQQASSTPALAASRGLETIYSPGRVGTSTPTAGSATACSGHSRAAVPPPPLQTPEAASSSATIGQLGAISAGLGPQILPVGVSDLVLPAVAFANPTAASGSGPSIISSSSVPSGSRGSLGSQAWPVMSVVSPSEGLPEEMGSQQQRGSYLGESGTIGSTFGGSSGKASPAAPESPALCETWLVTELCDMGTLARQASEWEPESDEQDMLCLLHLLRDVACGLKLLTSQSIVHADLNAHNVLVSSSPVAPRGMVAKVADLGLSRILKQQATHRTTRTVGMLTHQPPELLREGRMSPAVDVYSFGIMMYEVFTRQSAYARMLYGQIYHQVVVLGVRPSVPPNMPEDFELLMKRCWSADASERPSVEMLLECLELMIEDRRERAVF